MDNNSKFNKPAISNEKKEETKTLLQPFLRTPEKEFTGNIENKEEVKKFLKKEGALHENISNEDEIISDYQTSHQNKKAEIEGHESSVNTDFKKPETAESSSAEIESPVQDSKNEEMSKILKKPISSWEDNHNTGHSSESSSENTNWFGDLNPSISSIAKKINTDTTSSDNTPNSNSGGISGNTPSTNIGGYSGAVPGFTPNGCFGNAQNINHGGIYPGINNNLGYLQQPSPGYSQQPYAKESSNNAIQDSVKGSTEEKSTRPKSIDVAERLLSSYPICSVKGALYYFENGYYKLLSVDDAETLIISKAYSEIKETSSIGFMKSIYDFIRLHPSKQFTPNSLLTNYLAFNNVVVDLDTCKTYNNDGSIFVTSKIDTEFLGFDCVIRTDKFDEYLRTAAHGDPNLITLMLEVLGYYTSSDLSAQKFTVLLGPGATGKSVYGNLLLSFFNREAVTSMDINSLGDRFSPYNLVGKKLNLSMDLPDKPLPNLAVSNLKKYTGGDLVMAEAKYMPAFSFVNTSKFLFSSNHPIVTTTKDDGFARRMLILPFVYSVHEGKRNPKLLQELLAEKQGIIHKVLRFYLELKNRNYVFTPIDYNFYFAKMSSGNLSQAPNMYDIIAGFIQEFCIFGEGLTEHHEQIYAEYLKYCNAYGYPAYQNQADFTKVLYEICGDKITAKRFRKNNKNRQGAIGIALKTVSSTT